MNSPSLSVTIGVSTLNPSETSVSTLTISLLITLADGMGKGVGVGVKTGPKAEERKEAEEGGWRRKKIQGRNSSLLQGADPHRVIMNVSIKALNK